MEQITNGKEPASPQAKKIARLVWRHALTLYVLSLILRAVFSGEFEGRGSFDLLLGAMFVDWVKQFIKLRPFSAHYGSHPIHPHDDITVPPHIRHWWNFGVVGSPSSERDRYESCIKRD
jgi:hypothetical protein